MLCYCSWQLLRYKEIRIKPKKKKNVEEINSLLENRKWESCPFGFRRREAELKEEWAFSGGKHEGKEKKGWIFHLLLVPWWWWWWWDYSLRHISVRRKVIFTWCVSPTPLETHHRFGFLRGGEEIFYLHLYFLRLITNYKKALMGKKNVINIVV